MKRISLEQALQHFPTLAERNAHDMGIELEHEGVTFDFFTVNNGNPMLKITLPDGDNITFHEADEAGEAWGSWQKGKQS